MKVIERLKMTFVVHALVEIDEFTELFKDDGGNWFAVFLDEEGAQNFARLINGTSFKQVRTLPGGLKGNYYYVKLI